jgi:hypothetical protein
MRGDPDFAIAVRLLSGNALNSRQQRRIQMGLKDNNSASPHPLTARLFIPRPHHLRHRDGRIRVCGR